MRVSVSHLAKVCSLLLVLGSFSSLAVAQDIFFDDFEDRVKDQPFVDHGWTWYEQTFDTSTCTGVPASGFGPYDDEVPGIIVENRNYWTASAAEAGAGDSYYRAGLEVPAWEGALSNMLRVYGNRYNNAQGCVRVLVFQEMTIADTGVQTFSFDVAKDQYGAPANGEITAAFVKVLSPSNGYATYLDLSLLTTPPPATAPDNVTTASQAITFDIPAEWAGELLQFGFYSDVAISLKQSWATSGAYYDNAKLAPAVVAPPPENEEFDGIPIPTWALFGIAGLLAYFGGSQLRSRRKA